MGNMNNQHPHLSAFVGSNCALMGYLECKDVDCFLMQSHSHNIYLVAPLASSDYSSNPALINNTSSVSRIMFIPHNNSNSQVLIVGSKK